MTYTAYHVQVGRHFCRRSISARRGSVTARIIEDDSWKTS